MAAERGGFKTTKPRLRQPEATGRFPFDPVFLKKDNLVGHGVPLARDAWPERKTKKDSACPSADLSGPLGAVQGRFGMGAGGRWAIPLPGPVRGVILA
jgi:hypothetical protein